jgi:hypothetical protein
MGEQADCGATQLLGVAVSTEEKHLIVQIALKIPYTAWKLRD